MQNDAIINVHTYTYVCMDRRANEERVGCSYAHTYVEKDLAEDVGKNQVWISRETVYSK